MITIYVLLLEENKYYIGQTKNYNQRLKFHLKGRLGSDWTKKYKPIRTIKLIKTNLIKTEDALTIENSTTIEYMKLFGWRNVRGGDFCTLDEEKIRFLLILNSDINDGLIDLKITHNISEYINKECFFVLKLVNDNYFIGRTNNLRLALLNELNGLGSEWTKIHKPIELLSVIEIKTKNKINIRQLHNSYVITYMKKYGFHKIRGGDFYNVDTRNHKNKVINYTDIFKTFCLANK